MQVKGSLRRRLDTNFLGGFGTVNKHQRWRSSFPMPYLLLLLDTICFPECLLLIVAAMIRTHFTAAVRMRILLSVRPSRHETQMRGVVSWPRENRSCSHVLTVVFEAT